MAKNLNTTYKDITKNLDFKGLTYSGCRNIETKRDITMYVIRMKDKTEEHSFYEYTITIDGKCYIAHDKFKYAYSFNSVEAAQEILDTYVGGKDFEIVPYSLAEEEYYKCKTGEQL